MNLAYITVSFPSATETFVLREINYFFNNSERLTVFAYKEPISEWVNKDNLEWVGRAIYTKKRYWYNVLSSMFYFLTDIKQVINIARLWIKEMPSMTLKNNFYKVSITLFYIIININSIN